MVNLGGLGAVSGGWLSAMEQQAETDDRRVATQQRRQQVEMGQLDIAAQGGIGRTLQLLSGTVGPSLPAPQPGQQSQPAQPQQVQQVQAQPQQQIPYLPAGSTSPQPMTGQQAPLSGGDIPAGRSRIELPPQTARQAQPLQQGATGDATFQPPQAQPQPARGGQGATPQAGGGPLTLRELLASVNKANPGAPPQVVARIVDGMLPLLRVEEQSQWRQAQLAEKSMERQRKEREFDLKELRIREEFDQKVDLAQQRLLVAANDQERKAAKLELDKLALDQKGQLARTREDRLRELGSRRLDVEEEKEAGREKRSERAEEGRTTRTEITEAGRTKRTEATIASREGIAERGEQGKTYRADLAATLRREAEEGRNVRQSQQIVSREALAGLSAETKLEIADRLERGRTSRAELSNTAKKEIAGLNAETRTALTKMLEEGRERRFGQGIRTREQIAAGRLELEKRRVEAMEKRNQNQFELGVQRLGIAQTRLFGPDAEQQKKILTGAGVTVDEIQTAANYYNLTNKPQPVTGMSGQAKPAFERAYKNMADEILKAQGIADPAQHRRANEALVRAGQNTINRFLGAGPQGDNTRFLSVSGAHIDTAERLAAEWQASGGSISWLDIPALNRIKEYVWTQLGHPEATNIRLAAQILGTEIIKSLAVARAGTAVERQEIAERFAAVQSAEQFQGALQTARELLGGQMSGLKRQFVGAATQSGLIPQDRAERMFDSLLTTAAKDTQIEKLRNDPKWRRPFLSFDPDDFRSPGNKEREKLDVKPSYGGPQ